ncbi:MAG TPA: amidohydrolase [Chakrabartia sp.]|nr:amidohydrolase [Chakrabartia sp.]
MSCFSLPTVPCSLRSAAVAVALSASAAAQADTLIDNVNGLTLSEFGQMTRFKGLIVGEDGRVVRLLSGTEPQWIDQGKKVKKAERYKPAFPNITFRVDGKGRTMIPGLIDAHGHVMGLGRSLLLLDLSGTTSLGQAQAAIAAHAAEHGNRKWILGGGWNQESWALGRFPTAAELDAAIADRPAWLERVDGHAGWANSAALAAAGITAKTPDPAGGRIERDAAGRPTGVLVDAAMALVTKFVPPFTPKERDLAFGMAQEALLSSGVTAIADMGTSVDDWQVFRRAGDTKRLRLRIFSYADGLEPLLSVAGGEPTLWLYDDKLRMGGVKFYLDGALGSRGAWLKADYADKPGWRGLQSMEDTKLRNQMSRAALDGFQIAAHAIGDAANAQALDAFAELAPTYGGDRRWRIEHAQIIAPEDMPRFARQGVIASMQPVHQTSDRTMAETRLGDARLSGAYAWKSLIRTGAKLALGSDVPVERPDPFAGLAAAISRQDEKGEPAGGWRAEERLNFDEAFAAYTTGAAYAAFAESKVGRLTPGMRADFLLIDRDISNVSAAELRKTVLFETWVGGQPVWVRKARP